MPFTKVGPNQWRSPSGRLFNDKQVALAEAHGGEFPKAGSAYRKTQAANRKAKKTPPSSRLFKRPIGG
jgi:hypothetical protein